MSLSYMCLYIVMYQSPINHLLVSLSNDHYVHTFPSSKGSRVTFNNTFKGIIFAFLSHCAFPSLPCVCTSRSTKAVFCASKQEGDTLWKLVTCNWLILKLLMTFCYSCCITSPKPLGADHLNPSSISSKKEDPWTMQDIPTFELLFQFNSIHIHGWNGAEGELWLGNSKIPSSSMDILAEEFWRP